MVSLCCESLLFYYLQGKEKYDVLEIPEHILYNVRQQIPNIRKMSVFVERSIAMSGIYTLGVKTGQQFAMIDITGEIQSKVKESGITDGICVIYIPHTTAGITINENADPDVVRDFLMEMNKVIPLSDGYHHSEGNSAAHIKASMMGFSQTVIIEKGRLLLGTWQGIYFMEFDGPRMRKVHFKIMEG
jgi:secondary thiamine-phosphate synthase enzyme